MTALKPLVIYHAACRDGFCAAWVAYTNGWRDAEFVAGYYGQPPPDVAGRHVLITDFCYTKEQMKVLALRANYLTVYEHHKTAPEALDGLHRVSEDVKIVFDNTRSGAGITWDELAGGQRPWLVSYVEDRDLWKQALASTQEINAYIATLAFDFAVWSTTHENVSVSIAKEYGKIALAKTDQYVREVAKNARMVTFEGQRIPLVNAPQCDISELLHHLCEDFPFAMGWWQRADGMFIYSLRTRQDDLDVSEIAKKFGGGGHQKAAGFQLQGMLTL